MRRCALARKNSLTEGGHWRGHQLRSTSAVCRSNQRTASRESSTGWKKMITPSRDEAHSITCVSSSLSKIPYGGFSPVRLQTGIQLLRPSAITQRLKRQTRLRPPAPALYAAAHSPRRPLWPLRAWIPGPIVRMVQSRGPWLARRFYCPPRSSLTMASSAPLHPSPGFMDYGRGAAPCGLLWAGIERVPNLLCWSFLFVPSSVPRQTERLHLAVASPFPLAFAFFAQARHLCRHHRRFPGEQRHEAAKFTLCYGPKRLLALHRQGLLRSSFHLPQSPQRDVEYHYAGKSANSRDRTFTGKTSSIMGCKRRAPSARRPCRDGDAVAVRRAADLPA